MPEVEFREGANPVDKILADFDRRRQSLDDLSQATEQLIRTILEEKRIPIQSVQARVKRKDKLKSKYCKPDKDYKSLDDISDLVGFRIITYYSDKIDQIAEIVTREFAECGPREDKRIGKTDSFGYSAIHFDCLYLPERLKHTEYKRFAGARFEIQITTILGHAWAEMHHPWYDEVNSPAEEIRRFHRLAAVLELAEQEFLDIRKKREDRERIASVRVEAEAPEIPITVESLNAFIEQKHIVAEIDGILARILNGQLVAGASAAQLDSTVKFLAGAEIGTIQELEMILTKAGPALAEFTERCAPDWKLAQGGFYGNYRCGFSIAQMADFLICARGETKYRSFWKSKAVDLLPSLDVGKQAVIATEIAKKYHVFQD